MQTFKKKNITTIIILLLLPLTLISIYTIKQYFSRASGFTFKVTKNHQLSCTEQVENGNHVIVKVIDEAGAPLSGVTVEYWPDYNYPNSASANAPQGEGVTTGGQLDFNNLWPGCLSTCPDGKTNQMVKYFFKIKDQSSDTAAEISSGIWGNECAGAGYGSFCNINAVNVWGHWAYEIIFQKKAGDLAVDEIPTDHAGQAIVPADKRSACTYFDFYTPNQGFNPRRTGTTTPSSTPPAGGSPTPTPTSISLSNYCVDGFYKIPGEPVCSRAPFCGNNNSYALCEGGIPAVDPRSQDCMGDGDGQRVGCRGKPPLCCYEMARTGDPMMCCGSWERNWCYPSQCAKIDPEKSKICNGGTPGTCACGSATKATGPYCDKPGDILVDPPFSLEKRLGITPPTASTPTPSTTPYPLTPTPSSSPTPTSHPCPNYYVNCVRKSLPCPGNTVHDQYGSCGAEFRCCNPNLIAPTNTPTPISEATPTPTPTSSNPKTSNYALGINCGGNKVDIGNDIVYQADRAYTRGSYGYISRNNETYTSSWTYYLNLVGTEQYLYKSERFNLSGYKFDNIENGDYQVTLKFAEIYNGCFYRGCRKFDVSIQGTKVLTKFDIFLSAGGGNIEIDKTFNTKVTNNTLDIGFTKVTNSPKINAIYILKQ